MWRLHLHVNRTTLQSLRWFSFIHVSYFYRVRPSATDGVGGEYFTGTADGSRPGVFYVNLHDPTYKCVLFPLLWGGSSVVLLLLRPKGIALWYDVSDYIYHLVYYLYYLDGNNVIRLGNPYCIIHMVVLT